jgi:YacP-like NYN domain
VSAESGPRLGSRRHLVLVDAENVRRSLWPNISPNELVELCQAWAEREAACMVVVFDGAAPGGERELGDVQVVGAVSESADDRLVHEAAEATARGDEVRLVTSDRELRERVGHVAGVLGGGSFARELTATRRRRTTS